MMKKSGFDRKIWFYILLAEVLLLVAAGFFAQRRRPSELVYTQEELLDDSGEAAFYMDRSSECRYVTTPEFTLPRGMYTLTAQYESEGEAVLRVVHPGSTKYHSEVSGDIPLPAGNTVSCDFRVRYGERPLQVRGVFLETAGEGDYILLRDIRITYAACATRNLLFRLALFILALDGVIWLFLKRRSGGQVFWPGFEQVPWRALVLIVFFCSIPLTVDYLFLNAHDQYFHLMRIEGIRAGLESGMFPVRIQPGWLSGHGYASSVFYGDLFLYFPALLRYFGVSVQAAYKCYVVLINALTVGISYYTFGKMSRPHIGLCCAALYSLNIYRLTCIYTRGAVGEYTAMTFMPLVLYGLWKLYTMPEDSKAHKDSWIPITAGCTGIFLSHMISTEITAVFIALSAVLCGRRVLRKRTLLVTGKAVLATVLLNLWFLVPFLDYMVSGTYVINDADQYSSYHIEQTGVSAAQLFMNDYTVFGHSTLASEGLASEMPLTVGIALMLVPAGWFLMCTRRREGAEGGRKAEFLAVFFSCLSLWMATSLFPYTWLADKMPFLELPIASVQYLWRNLSAAALMLCWLFGLILQKEHIPRERRKWFMGALTVLSLLQAWSYMSRCLQDGEAYRVYQAGNMSTVEAMDSSSEPQSSVMGGEYLPVDRKEAFAAEDYLASYTEGLSYDADCLLVESWESGEGLAVLVKLRNETDSVRQLEVPRLLYKGYRAVTETGEQLAVLPGPFFRVSVAVPAGFSGSIRVDFREPWYWRGSEILSLAAFFAILFCKMGFPGKKKVEKTNIFTFSG